MQEFYLWLYFFNVRIGNSNSVETITLESAVKVSSKSRIYSIEPNKKIFKL